MTKRELLLRFRLLVAGALLLSLASSALGVLIVLQVLHHDLPGWVGAPIGIALASGIIFLAGAS